MVTQVQYGIDFGTSTLLASVKEGVDTTVLPLGGLGQSWIESSCVETASGFAVGLDVVGATPLQREGRMSEVFSPKERITAAAPGTDLEFLREPVQLMLQHVLAKMESLGHDPRRQDVRIACPVAWDAHKRRFLIECARNIGLSKVNLAELIEEPIAAAAKWLQENPTALGLGEFALVFDCGGGTTDTAILTKHRIEDSAEEQLSVVVTHGTDRAGNEADRALALWFLKRQQAQGIEVPDGLIESLRFSETQLLRLSTDAKRHGQRGEIVRAAREAKEQLSRSEVFTLSVPGVNEPWASGAVSRGDLLEALGGWVTDLVKFADGTARSARYRLNMVIKDPDVRPDGPTTIPAARQEDAEVAHAPIRHIFVVGGMASFEPLVNGLHKKFSSASIHVDRLPQESVVRGLAPRPTFRAFSMVNPGFALKCEVKDHDGTVLDTLTLYEAFTVLATKEGVLHANDREGARVELAVDFPRRSTGRLFVEWPDGMKINVVVSEEGGFDPSAIEMGNSGVLICKVYPHGEVYVREPAGRRTWAQVGLWPSGRDPKVKREIVWRVARRPSHEESDNWRNQNQ